MQYRKLGKATDHRMSMLKNQVSCLLWNGRIETTEQKAKEVRKLAEKLVTQAINTYEDTVKVTKTVKTEDSKGKPITKSVEFTNDGPRKLIARRKIMANTHDLQELKAPKEAKFAFKERTKDIRHPLIEKIFNEYAPKYAQRAEDKGSKGGYVRIIHKGFRRGDNAEMVIIEMV